MTKGYRIVMKQAYRSTCQSSKKPGSVSIDDPFCLNIHIWDTRQTRSQARSPGCPSTKAPIKPPKIKKNI